MKYNGLDVYNATISTIEDGIIFISLVDFPAVERDFVCFKEVKEPLRFKIENDEKRIISGVVMLANSPIYRVNGDYEYYITYSPETLQKMAEKCLSEGTFKNIDLQHNNRKVEGVNLIEVYIKDSSKGINPNFVDDVPEGSLMASFHITNDDIWNEIKNSDFLKGFSLEGFFSLEKMSKANNNDINNTKMKNLFKKLLVKFASVETDKGTLYYADELAVGVDVFVDNENVEVAADGEYETEDKVIVVADGKVAEIREKEVEQPEPEAEPEVEVENEEVPEPEAEPEPVADPNEERIAALEEKVAGLESEIAALKDALAKLVEQPQADPVEEEFENVKQKEVVGLPKAYQKSISLFKK